MKIGIFDSGVGGLSCLKVIKQKIDFVDMVYYGDNLNNPYGSKSVEEIQGFCVNIVDFLINKKKVDMIVIACNTATSVALDLLKEKFPNTPILGVVHAGAVMAVRETKNKKIAVISTPVTAESNVYKKDILEIDPTCEVTQEGCEELAPRIEKGWHDDEENLTILRDYLNTLPKDIDTLVLGCTHYPLIRPEIAKILGDKILIVDPAEELALESLKELTAMAKKRGIELTKKEKINIDYCISGDVKTFEEVGGKFLGEPITTGHHPE